MKVEHVGITSFNRNNNNTPTFKGIYNSKTLKKGLEFASDNGVMFSAVTCVVLSSIFRPIAVLLTPKAKKEDKQYTCARSITSGLLNFGLTLAITTPIILAVDNIAKNPTKFLNKKTIDALKGKENKLNNNKGPFGFATQMIKLSSQFLTAEPKAYLSCALVPPLMSMLFKTERHPNQKINRLKEDTVQISNSKVSFKSNMGQNITNKLSKGIAKIFNWEPLQKASKKYHNTNFAQHMFSLNDIYLTALFVKYTNSNKDIKESRKKTLNYNAILQTGITIPLSYGINALSKKPTEKFIENLKAANKNDPKIDKYIEGIKIAKPALIMGVLYYVVMPVVCTMLADVVSRKFDGDNKKQ